VEYQSRLKGVFLLGQNKEAYSEHRNNSKIDAEPKAKARFASKRPDGSINTHPQERMHAATQQEA
jgi:small acid-soluble spore protein K (minor)